MSDPKVWLILIVSLFTIGLYGMLTRRHALGMLISLELMLNACGLAFVFFEKLNRLSVPTGEGMTLFIIAVAAAEVVAALALFILTVQSQKTTDMPYIDQLAVKEKEIP